SPNNLIGGALESQRNVISNNLSGTADPLSDATAAGVLISGGAADGNQVQGNYIGTDPRGAVAVPNTRGVEVVGAPNTKVGYPVVGGGNLISGNLRGIDLEAGADRTYLGNN